MIDRLTVFFGEMFLPSILGSLTMKEQVTYLNVNEVEIRDHLERTKLDILSLAESIETIGQINPITVKKRGSKYQVVAGRRRFSAVKHLEAVTGKKHQVLAIVRDLDDIQEELILIDENLMRQDLSETEVDEALYRRKQLYEELHPETKKNVVGGYAKRSNYAKAKPAFSEDAAKRLGTSRRTVEKAIARASKATDKVKQAREAGLLSPSKVDLLVTLEAKDQDILLPAVKGADLAEVKDLVDQAKKRGARAVVLDLGEVKQEDQRLKSLLKDALKLSEMLQEALEERLTLSGDAKHDSLRSLDELSKRIQNFTSFQRSALGYVAAISRRGDERKTIRQRPK
jgi:ParB-like chromosome segregation protein Spo0J